MPFPTEHACRLRNPDDFKPNSFRRTSRESDGKKYFIIMGKLKGETSMTEQAYRYKKDTWTASEAKSHCTSHDGSFEAASGDSQLTPGEDKMTLDTGRARKALPFVSFKDISTDDAPGTIEAIVSVFNNKDFANEVVMPGAFANSLQKKLPRMVWGHDWLTPVGKTLVAMELLPGDPRLPPMLASLGGLYVKGQFNLNTSRGRDAYEDLKFGAIDEFSIGYKVVRAHRITEEGEQREVDLIDMLFGFGGKSVLYLDELDLIEWSPVLAGMNDSTQLIGIKMDAPIVAVIDQADAALGVVMRQVEAYAESRTKEGRTFSTANYAKLEGFADRLEEMSAELRGLLSSAAKERKPKVQDEGETVDSDEPGLITVVPAKDITKLIADFERTRFEIGRMLAGV